VSGPLHRLHAWTRGDWGSSIRDPATSRYRHGFTGRSAAAAAVQVRERRTLPQHDHGRPAPWPDIQEVARIRWTRVILAAAHLDHDPGNNRPAQSQELLSALPPDPRPPAPSDAAADHLSVTSRARRFVPRPLFSLTGRQEMARSSFSRSAVRGGLTGKPQSEKDIIHSHSARIGRQAGTGDRGGAAPALRSHPAWDHRIIT
jgi:hypothetical protein